MSAPGAPGLLRPDWPAPARVRAAFSLRDGGVSGPPWASLNLGTHVGDDPAAVLQNRRRLATALDLPAEPCWLEQVHGTDVWRPGAAAPGSTAAAPTAPPRADAVVVDQPGIVAAIMVADCIPVLFCDRDGRCVAAAHAGWRGLVAGVLENTVAAMGLPPSRLLAWLGPAIGPARFEVGGEVRDAFLDAARRAGPRVGSGGAADAEARAMRAAARFRPGQGDRWMCDLTGLARDRLQALGVGAVTGGEWCTASDPARFFSHRRDAARTGRMAALVWLAPPR
jgi:YfiH family protein